MTRERGTEETGCRRAKLNRVTHQSLKVTNEQGPLAPPFSHQPRLVLLPWSHADYKGRNKATPGKCRRGGGASW